MKEEPNYYSIITYNVLYSDKISSSEKLLYATLTSLSQKDGYCYASNKYLSELYKTSDVTISRQLNKLKSEGFIEIIYEKSGGVIINRKIEPLTKMLTAVNKNVNGAVNKNVKDNNISNINNISINNIFKKPSVEEIKKYCEERKNNIDAESFYDFYESKGWYVGKNKMKDWKACIRTWEQRNKKNNIHKSKTATMDETLKEIYNGTIRI